MFKRKILFIFIILVLFIFSSCEFNLFRPKNLGDIIKNLPKEEQLSIAEDALSNVSSPQEAASIKDSLINSWGSDLSNGAQTEQEAQAAYLIAQATTLADPVLFETFTIIQTLASGGSLDNNNLGSALSNLSEDPNALQNAINAIIEATNYLNMAAQYDQGTSEIDPGLQILNAMFNIVSAINTNVNNNGGWTNETAVQNALNGINLSNPSNQQETNAKNSLEAVINSPNTSDTLKQLAQSLLNL